MTDETATSPRWQQIEELFFNTAGIPEAQRAAFLDNACAGDPELRREIESLFGAETQPGPRIEALIESAATALFDEHSMEGARFGAYRIVREIGRGGMGAVYLAVRADEEFRKQVAIKLVKRGIDTDAVLKRFRQERQILAVLDHPNIARLLDGGTTPDGLPYFVLEYVEGKPIQSWCEERKLTAAQRCELFRKVCDPVSFAHRKLVIHRDLKPANILVTPEGEPKLLDFGIAKLLATETGLSPEDSTLALTLEPVRALTPAYASPEQVRGEPVSTATDVFSLGAVLFEMLTGVNPHNPAAAALRKTLDPDLANIVAMATRPEPERRYASVDQLSEDVRRCLTGLPVVAREDTWRYRAGKFLGRNRFPVAAAAVFAALLIGGVISVAWEAHQADIQRQRAEQRLGEMLELANRTLFDVHGSIERLPGATNARREIVQATLEYLDKLNNESGNDTRILSSLVPAYMRLATIEGDPLQPNLGDLRASEDSYRKAGKILDSLLDANPANGDLQMRFAEYSYGYGSLLAATARIPAAIEHYRRGIAATARVLAHDPGNFEARKNAAALHNALDKENSLNDPYATRKDVVDQIQANTRLVAEHPRDADCILALAQNYSQLGTLAGRDGQTRESIAWYRKSVELREQALTVHPNDVSAQRELMMSYGHIGDMLGSPFLLSLGDTHGAREYYSKAEKIAEAMASADRSDKQAQFDLGIVLMRIGSVLEAPGEETASLAALNQSAKVLEPLFAAETKNINYSRQLALVYEYAGQRLKQLGKYPAAVASYRRSLDVCARLEPGDPRTTRQRLNDNGALASLLAKLGQRDEAIRIARETLSTAEPFSASRQGSDRIYYPRALNWSGAVYENLNDLPQAADFYRKSLHAWEQLDSENRAHFANEILRTRQNLSRCERSLTTQH